MAKKKKSKGRGQHLQRSASHRMQFLHAAALLMSDLGAYELAHNLERENRKCSQKACLRLDKSTRLSVCMYCSNVQVPGVTLRVRVVDDVANPHLLRQCIACGRARRYHVAGMFSRHSDHADIRSDGTEQKAEKLSASMSVNSAQKRPSDCGNARDNSSSSQNNRHGRRRSRDS
ncbi:MAG: hypothetical protein MHM6MM_000887 [Cercozoa sp. M6MM]